MRWKALLLALFLGLALPGILISVAEKYCFHSISKNSWEHAEIPNQSIANETIRSSEEYDSESILQIPVLFRDGVVETMDLEKYILSVVLGEMPADFEFEALKAQAVVARTYTMRLLSRNGKHRNSIVCTDANCCQGYCSPEEYINRGGNQMLLEKVTDAVNETEGLILTFNGEIIEATYFSSSGGKTEDAAAVWGAEIPYLKSTDSPGEEGSEHYISTVVISKDRVASLLGFEPRGDTERWIGEITYTNGGGVDSIEICGQVYKGTYIRRKLGLRSTAFSICVVGDSVSITTRGFGHRVGMSQYGAEAMAVSGSKFDEILRHYYKNVELEHYSVND